MCIVKNTVSFNLIYFYMGILVNYYKDTKFIDLEAHQEGDFLNQRIAKNITPNEKDFLG